MAQHNLKKLLGKNPGLTTVLTSLETLSGHALSVEDIDGNLVLGLQHLSTESRYPITLQDDIVGWVAGGGAVGLVAPMIAHLASVEDARRAINTEVLNLFREINLVYNLAEKLGGAPDVPAIGRIALEEMRRFIPATEGALVLVDEANAGYVVAASFADGDGEANIALVEPTLIAQMMENGKAEIINDVRNDPRYAEMTACTALVYAPLKVDEKVIGILMLTAATETTYSAAHLKLLTTVVSLASPAVEHALLHEKLLREARAREEGLQQQIQELRIELDVARQEQQVSAITGTEYFQNLREQAEEMRKRHRGAEGES